jgi:hypothetical protein
MAELPSLAFADFGQRRAFKFAQRVEPRVASDARREIRSIDFAQGADERVAAFLADFAVPIAAAVVETRVAMPFMGA